jgi:hypothetical protein
MKALLIIAGLFFALFGGVFAYYAVSDPSHEYDLKFVMPIDARQMPKPIAPPAIQSWTTGEAETAPAEGRVEAGAAPALPDRPPVQFGVAPGAASESSRY